MQNRSNDELWSTQRQLHINIVCKSNKNRVITRIFFKSDISRWKKVDFSSIQFVVCNRIFDKRERFIDSHIQSYQYESSCYSELIMIAIREFDYQLKNKKIDDFEQHRSITVDEIYESVEK